MIEWYVLHVQPEKEEKVAEILRKKLSLKLYRPFIPQIEKFYRRAGITTKFRKICFPGYVFIESQTSGTQFNATNFMLLYSIKEVYSLLRYGGKDEIAMPEQERNLLKQLLGEDDCIMASKGNIIDGKIQIDSGALVGIEYAIQKIERHNKEAKIEIELMGKAYKLCVGLEILSKS